MYAIVIGILFFKKDGVFLADINSSGHSLLGIDSNSVSSYANSIVNNIEIIKSVFANIENISNETVNFFNGEIADSFRYKMSDICYFFPLIEKNLLTYVEDLNTFITNYKNFDQSYKVGDVTGISVNSDIGV